MDKIDYLQARKWSPLDDVDLQVAAKCTELADEFTAQMCPDDGLGHERDLADQRFMVKTMAQAAILQTIMWAHDNLYISLSQVRNGEDVIDVSIGGLLHGDVPIVPLIMKDHKFLSGLKDGSLKQEMDAWFGNASIATKANN